MHGVSTIARAARSRVAAVRVARGHALSLSPSLSLPARAGRVVAAVAPARGYHETVIEHNENPRNVGSLDKSAQDVGTGLVGAPACGDVMKLQIKVEDGVVVDAKFKTFGCGSAIAASSVATEWLKGRTIDDALNVKNTDIAAHLKLPPVKLHCSMLAEDAIKAAVKDFQTKNEATA
mmetsp:Transcript_28364/g.67161  ORF Transcript_28364/g.67161 Transcript_28364/m.67161 type:complete len:177 (+) Transcript_28364:252-782(+)